MAKRGVLPGPSPTLTFSPIYGGLDVAVTYRITWFRPNYDTVLIRLIALQPANWALAGVS